MSPYLVVFALSVVTIVASVASTVVTVRQNHAITANLEYAARMHRATEAFLRGIENDDTAWYYTNPPLPGEKS